MSNLTFTLVRPAQARALARIADSKTAPKALVIALDRDDDDNLIVVPASGKDRRRWNISKGGQIRKDDR